jgi:hypothetical protein
MDAMPDGGTLTLSAKAREDKVEFAWPTPARA